MAHIADFMVDTQSNVGLNNYIARELSPSPHAVQDSSIHSTPVATPTEEKEKFVWRMHQPAEPRKYQLFPAKEKLSLAAGRKSPDAETALQQAKGQHGAAEKIALPAMRLKPKEPTLVRRRKVSVPELGPMTTVQEVAMDSPTIPGRPPLHERSISAPGNSWRQHVFGESMLSCISGPALDENAEIMAILDGSSLDDGHDTPRPSATPSPKQPLSPKSLAPLIIPAASAYQPRLTKQSSNPSLANKKPSAGRARTGSVPPDVPPKSARMLDGSPSSKASPYTPHSASTGSLSTAPTSVASTPLSAQPTCTADGRSSPKPWPVGPSCSANGHTRGQSESTNRPGPRLGHRRGESEASIMDRGRPKKRADGSPIKRKPSDEQKAFETLPQGIRATDANGLLPAGEIEVLRKQALGQASRFEVLSSKDVESLSRELRGLDERCDYLRKTHRSLRAGRRNLHDRICSFLRSPRVARFSHASILKQEEALSELDSSIDDWVSKLEQAENRRTRVRQKLLEHVAGALIMPPTRHHSTDTPPRSPTKARGEASPARLAAPLQVPSPEPISRRDVESIRVYADSDISALLKDVEEEITRMGEESTQTIPFKTNPASVAKEEEERKVDESGAVQAGITLTAMTYEAGGKTYADFIPYKPSN